MRASRRAAAYGLRRALTPSAISSRSHGREAVESRAWRTAHPPRHRTNASPHPYLVFAANVAFEIRRRLNVFATRRSKYSDVTVRCHRPISAGQSLDYLGSRGNRTHGGCHHSSPSRNSRSPRFVSLARTTYESFVRQRNAGPRGGKPLDAEAAESRYWEQAETHLWPRYSYYLVSHCYTQYLPPSFRQLEPCRLGHYKKNCNPRHHNRGKR